MVLLAADGRTAPQIAPLVQRSAVAVWRVLTRYRTAGPPGVLPRRRPGRPRAAPSAWLAELRRVIELDPHAVGVERANWTTGLLAAYLARATVSGLRWTSGAICVVGRPSAASSTIW